MSYGTEVIVGFALTFWVGMSLTLGFKYLQFKARGSRCWCGIHHFPHRRGMF